MLGALIGSFTSVPVANSLLKNEIENTTSSYDDVSKNFGIDREERPVDNGHKYNFGIAQIKQVDKIDAVVDFKVLGELLGIGVLLTLLSSLASMVTISRFSPLTILKERS